MVYYNENDPGAAAWLDALITAGLIPDGYIDERSITDVKPHELRGFKHCHFFAGVGGWPYALNLAGWPTDEPIWTGSCPCQPFSEENRVWEGGNGIGDARDLWPIWFNLVKECGPATVVGEQVEDAIAHGWLDRAFDDLERGGYACGAHIIPALSVGTPHKRDRLWFVGHSEEIGRKRFRLSLSRTLARMKESTRGVRLPEQVLRIAGENGSLNPAFVCWLMGYPEAWTRVADFLATPSSRKSRRNS